MIPLDDALALIEQTVTPLAMERIAFDASIGRVLAEPVMAARTQPPFAASAMDGYAVRSADLAASPVQLTVRGEAAAGRASGRAIAAGECQRISTGAPVPDGADQIVIQENAVRTGDRITTSATPDPGRHIRKAGIDFVEGDHLLDRGVQLTPRRLSLVVSAGLTELNVVRQPRTAILSTGDELVEPGQAPHSDQIINSLAPGLVALVRQWGGEPAYLGIARDDPAQVREQLMKAADFDMLLTIGGASVGDHDHLRETFRAMGGQSFFEKIAIKPGKPTWFGRLGKTWVLGLPGNPVSAMVMARLCLRSLLDALLGRTESVVFQSAVLTEALDANGSREALLRAVCDRNRGSIMPVSNQDSSALSALSTANALIRRPANAASAKAGDTVACLFMDEM
ncbi:gephyrin-like molybdotransferase Glp [Hyphobacterium sp.]|jgi:molybdopterin molybdotransferase|uniref:molybdopterin molybdotransferase MoeA n=1 Tax=Hyphobacterium sp. TaxID=2004662 RepID=UPI003BA8AF61